MKTLIVCDSGLGGLDIAASFFRKNEPAEWDLIYFNAFPDAKIGYNDLADDRMKEDVFQNVLESMERYSPAMCLSHQKTEFRHCRHPKPMHSNGSRSFSSVS